jgi:hypothetical protein
VIFIFGSAIAATDAAAAAPRKLLRVMRVTISQLRYF